MAYISPTVVGYVNPIVDCQPDIKITPRSMYEFLLKNRKFSNFLKLCENAGKIGMLNDPNFSHTIFLIPNEHLSLYNLDFGSSREIVDSLTLNGKITRNELYRYPITKFSTRNPSCNLIINKGTVNSDRDIPNKVINDCSKIIDNEIILQNGIFHVVNNSV